MSDPARQLMESRAARNAARSAFDSGLAQVKEDLAARSVVGRITDKLVDDAQAVLDEALDVARDSKGVIAGTIAALGLWFLRNPIMAWAESLFVGDPDEEEENCDDDA